MPKQKRIKTDYPGVYFIEGKQAGTDKPERIYYIYYRKDGKKIEEKAGRQFKDNMTPAKANQIRSGRITGKQKSNEERRKEREAKKKTERNKWTIDRLWKEYTKSRTKNKALATDEGRYNKYLKKPFGNKEPKNIAPLDVDRLRITLLKTKSPQTVKHVLNLCTWIVNFGVKKNLCDGLQFHVQKPEVHNEKTEDLTPDQLTRLLDAIEKDDHPHAGAMMLMALYTGMRRGEMFKLKWSDIDFDRGFIHIVDPKGGPDQKIPLNDAASELLENLPKHETSEFVFPGRGGRQRTEIAKDLKEIKDNAGLPENFRPLHGLRHAYASALASSGKVDMYTLQKLLTHKSPLMTQRYAHLRDEALRNASNVASDIFSKSVTTERDKTVDMPK